MNCENLLCIYQRDGECMLTEISIDRMGVCENCLYPDYDKVYVEYEKSKLLMELDSRDKMLDDE